MDAAILSTRLKSSRDLPSFRRRTRDVAELVGLTRSTGTRLVAAGAEVARGLLNGGEVSVRFMYRAPDLVLVVRPDCAATTRLPDVASLVDRVVRHDDGVIELVVQCHDDGAILDGDELASLGRELHRRAGDDPSRELERQHDELLSTLSALQRAERLANEATREQAELLELVPAIVWMAKPDGTWTFVSKRWMERTGQSPERALELWMDFVAEPGRNEWATRWADGIASGAPFVHELAVHSSTGTARWHRLRAVPITAGGSVEKWLGVLVDIDDSRKREAQAARVTNFMKQMIGVVGHDLRAPLNVATAAAGALRLRSPNADDAMIQRIESSMMRAGRMISSLLDYTRAELGGGIPIITTEVDLSATLRELVDSANTAHPQAKIELVTEGDLTVVADADRMMQAVGNLVENAAAHADLRHPIVVKAACDGETLTVEVQNRGQTIPKEQLSSLFQPFQRGTNNNSRKGLGLGLYIVAEIARGHGGDVTITSNDHDGTCVHFVIPRRPRLPTVRT